MLRVDDAEDEDEDDLELGRCLLYPHNALIDSIYLQREYIKRTRPAEASYWLAGSRREISTSNSIGGPVAVKGLLTSSHKALRWKGVVIFDT